MNYVDVSILLIIVLFVSVGIYKGLVVSVMKLASSFIALALAIIFRPIMSSILKKTYIFESMKMWIGDRSINVTSIENKLMESDLLVIDNSIISESIIAPEFFKDWLFKLIKNENYINLEEIINGINESVAGFVIDLISIVSVFIIIRILLIVIRILLKKFMSLPVLKELDKVGGGLLGLSEALIVIFVILGVVMMFQLTGKFDSFLYDVNNSLFGKYFYYNNVIFIWLTN